MDHAVEISLAVGLAVVVLYVIVMRIFFRDSQALDRKIDYSKMKKWEDEDEEKAD